MSDPQTDVLVKAAAGLFTEIFKGAYKTSLGWIKGKNETHDFFNKKAEAYGRKMAKRYNNMKVLGMSGPRPLSSIFVRANILEKITSESYTKLEELKNQFDFEKKGFGVLKDTKPGLEVAQSINKFIVLGKPGSGKTTFLKRIVLHSLEGDFTFSRLPIFIGLKEYSESGKTLFEYIVNEFDICSLPDAEPFIENLLKNGKGQILLDGLDEVKKENEDRVIQEIKNLSTKYEDCQYILSCRISAFNVTFEHFTDVEMADFNDDQIEQFIKKWFGKNQERGEGCWVKVKKNNSIKELANSPILLTLLCIGYDDNLGFPENRSDIYDEAIETLLKKWDTSRGIEREGRERGGKDIYKSLSYNRRKTLLSIVAFQTFSQGEFFIPERRLEKQIGAYIENLPQVKEISLEVDSKEVLKSIIAQHGLIVPRAKKIYSFSHLTLQEYFTGNFLISGPGNEKLLKHAIEGYALNPQWREVFLLTAGMLDSADHFLITLRKYIDQFTIENQLSPFLEQINAVIKPDSLLRKHGGGGGLIVILFILDSGFADDVARTNEAETRFLVRTLVRVLIRAFDLSLNLGLDRIALELGKDRDFYFSTASDLTLTRDLYFVLANAYDRTLAHAFDRTHPLDLDLAHVLDLDLDINFARNAHTRALDLNLYSYLKLNQLLIDCLNSGAYVSKAVRKDILDNLLLPPSETTEK